MYNSSIMKWFLTIIGVAYLVIFMGTINEAFAYILLGIVVAFLIWKILKKPSSPTKQIATETWFCSNCGNDDMDFLICSYCGTAKTDNDDDEPYAYCLECGIGWGTSEKFCPDCGTKF